MKTLKVLAIIGIVTSAIGVFGSVILLIEEDPDGTLGLVLFGYYLAFSIVAIKTTKKVEDK